MAANGCAWLEVPCERPMAALGLPLALEIGGITVLEVRLEPELFQGNCEPVGKPCPSVRARVLRLDYVVCGRAGRLSGEESRKAYFNDTSHVIGSVSYLAVLTRLGANCHCRCVICMSMKLSSIVSTPSLFHSRFALSCRVLRHDQARPGQFKICTFSPWAASCAGDSRSRSP